jgi:crotonobetaine/carnitine-CoA ligase
MTGVVARLTALAESDPDRLWLRYADGSAWSSRDLWETAAKWATAYAQEGIRTEDRVAIMLDNSPTLVPALLGSAFLKGVNVPVNTSLRGGLLQHLLRVTSPRAIVTSGVHLPHILEALPAVDLPGGIIFVTDRANPSTPASPGWRIEDRFDVSGLATTAPLPAEPWDPFGLMLTSGTTGRSKATLWNHGTAEQWATVTADHMGYDDTDTLYSCLPLFHANALATVILPAMVARSSVFVDSAFSVSRYWPQLSTAGATATNLLGTMVNLLLAQPAGEHERRHRLRTMLISPCTEATHRQVVERFGVAPVGAYGLTDYGMLTWTRVDSHSPPGTCGSALSDAFDIDLVDDHDRPVPEGVIGEMVARSKYPWITPERYLGMPEETLVSRSNLWFHTGDLLRRDEAGWYYFVGRKKDAMRRSGENVSAFEVEEAALTFPGLLEAAAYALPAEKGEDEIALAVVPSSGLISPRDLVLHMAQDLPYFAVPRYVRVVEQLPKNKTQKVEKVVLQNQGTDGIWDREADGIRITRAGVRIEIPDKSAL